LVGVRESKHYAILDPIFLGFALLQTGCAHTNEQKSDKKIGYIVNPNGGALARIDYDVEDQGKSIDCFFYATSGTAVEVLSKKGIPEGWQLEASNIRVLEGPFSGADGYLGTVYIQPHRTETYEPDLVEKATGPPPCSNASKVNDVKVQAIEKELFSRQLKKIQQR
jgi:hypothetical protein